MPIVIASRRIAYDTLVRRFGFEALILDVTSRGPRPWVRVSPFYPHGSIPVPFSPGVFGASVEGIWQGLKVFEHADVDRATLAITSMHSIKRSARTYGHVLGHRAGITGDRLLSYAQARRQIYLPSYKWVLEHCLGDEIERIRGMAADHTVVLLDYETNADVDDLSRPLSHASLIKRYLDSTWPISNDEAGGKHPNAE